MLQRTCFPPSKLPPGTVNLSYEYFSAIAATGFLGAMAEGYIPCDADVGLQVFRQITNPDTPQSQKNKLLYGTMVGGASAGAFFGHFLRSGVTKSKRPLLAVGSLAGLAGAAGTALVTGSPIAVVATAACGLLYSVCDVIPFPKECRGCAKQWAAGGTTRGERK